MDIAAGIKRIQTELVGDLSENEMGLGLWQVLLIACATVAIAWFAVRKLAPAWRKPLLPVFAGFTGGLFLTIAYLFSGKTILAWLAIPVAIIVYFNITGRRGRR